MNETEKYLKGLQLSSNDAKLPVTEKSYLSIRSTKGLEGLEESKEETFVNFKSLNSFVAGVSQQKQEDILNSLLLAQRVAQKQFPGDEQMADWYKKYFEVLTRLGWVFEDKGFSTYNVKGKKFEMDKAVLEILGVAVASATGLAAAAALAILTKTIAAVKNLADKDSRIVAFEKNTHSVSKGNFQMGLATEENGAVSILSSAFILETTDQLKTIFFFKSTKGSTTFKFNIIKATISDSVFSSARNMVKEKLVEDINEYIADLEI